MKKTMFVFITSMMISSVMLAQDIQPAIKSGAKSLNFTFGGLGAFGLGAAGVNGGVSLSYFLTSDAAVRLGLQVQSNSTSTPWNDPSGNNTNPGADGSTSAFALGLGADYLMYMGSGRVRPYLGAGFSFTMNSSDNKPAISNTAANGTLTETKNGTNGNEGITLGLNGIAGAEFFLYPELSVSGEYLFTLFSLTSRSDSEVSRKGQTATTTKNGSATQILGFGTAACTVHIYF